MSPVRRFYGSGFQFYCLETEIRSRRRFFSFLYWFQKYIIKLCFLFKDRLNFFYEKTSFI